MRHMTVVSEFACERGVEKGGVPRVREERVKWTQWLEQVKERRAE